MAGQSGGRATRRHLIAAASGLLAIRMVRPAWATPDERDAAIEAFTRGEAPVPGRVTLDLPRLVENGNAAPLTVTVDSPMTAEDHVRRIAVFNERNPQPNVITVLLGPHSGRASVSTRIRLATSQRITAVAETSDGRFHVGSADVIVTLAACVEGT